MNQQEGRQKINLNVSFQIMERENQDGFGNRNVRIEWGLMRVRIRNQFAEKAAQGLCFLDVFSLWPSLLF